MNLDEALDRVGTLLLDHDGLVRAIGSGRRKGHDRPAWRRVELRYVDLREGRHLQVTSYDETQAHTANHPVGESAAEAVSDLLDVPFGNWHVDTTDETVQVRVTKKGDGLVHAAPREQAVEVDRDHDRDKARLLPADDPVLVALGISDRQGRVKPTRQAKYRQVEEFLRVLDAAVREAVEAGHLRSPTADDPLRVVDLGCGNAYLTLAAHRFLTEVRGLPVRLTGVDVREQSRRHNDDVARGLGIDADFVAGTISDAELEQPPDVVLALHACDTATDDALVRAVRWGSPLVLAAPCCHHDVAAQLRRAAPPAPYASLVRHGILRERFADTLTDALRASLLRLEGYRVEVIEFVESAHTPRNTLLRAVRTGDTGGPALRSEYADLVAAWDVTPRLGELLGDRGTG
ncbi:class I SAM-dependent methyltransferase [Nocardioides sp. GXQ0305]|uniref:class I SAM-dependent methyltransferase n=1 Tax=Nocardioides sp. GXQ0305 TaxID=3423912 RepID=UPI003D7EB9A7